MSASVTTITNNQGRINYQLSFEISPIVLVNGIASNSANGMLPITAITQSIIAPFSLDQYFAHFRPLPNTNLLEYQVAMYPFANQAIAANAMIKNPSKISMLMTCPVQTSGGYADKLLIMTALQNALDLHNISGGTYIVVTPSFVFNNCLLLSIHDVSGNNNKQPQVDWQFDFLQPLITQQQAQQAQNTLMNKIAQGLPTDGSLSGPGLVSGNPYSGAVSLVQSGQNLQGTSVTPSTVGSTPPSSILV